MASTLHALRSCPRGIRRHGLALAAALACSAHAQDATQTVTVSGRANAPAPAVTGFGDEPLARTPLAATSITSAQLANAGIGALSGLTLVDASIADNYNAPGYWSNLTVRGFQLDSRYSYRRDGLPISAETVIPIDNKERLEVLKGLSGLQAGTSAPGGLANLVVKRPTQDLRSVTLGFTQGGALQGAADVSQRFGEGQAFGVRVNAALEHLDTRIENTGGHRQLASVAADWRVPGGALLEAELEWSHQSQPSVPGLSLLGSRVPAATEISPWRNLNDQPWSLPVVFGATTASLRWTQPLAAGWTLQAHAMQQQLATDDRLAYPYGCSAENNYSSYCSDGSFDYYGFRSDAERRTSRAAQLQLQGTVDAAGLRHALAAGVLATGYRTRILPRPDDGTVVGTGSVYGTAAPIASLPALAEVPSTNRRERSTELFLRDHASLTPTVGLWAGLRHTRLSRESERTDGSRATAYDQGLTAPFAALSWQATPALMGYASWGRGMESEVAPNRSFYANAGEALPALQSRQLELGAKFAGTDLDASMALFDIHRPATTDLLSANAQANGYCSAAGDCTRVVDGQWRHLGLESAATWRLGTWTLDGSAMWLRARRENAVADATFNGLRPTNVPARSLRLQAAHALAAVPGLTLSSALVAESDRMALPDNSVRIPGWSHVDVAARYVIRHGHAVTTTLRAGIDNVADRRAWRESPYQYGHAYLYALTPRTWRASAQMQF